MPRRCTFFDPHWTRFRWFLIRDIQSKHDNFKHSFFLFQWPRRWVLSHIWPDFVGFSSVIYSLTISTSRSSFSVSISSSSVPKRWFLEPDLTRFRVVFIRDMYVSYDNIRNFILSSNVYLLSAKEMIFWVIFDFDCGLAIGKFLTIWRFFYGAFASSFPTSVGSCRFGRRLANLRIVEEGLSLNTVVRLSENWPFSPMTTYLMRWFFNQGSIFCGVLVMGMQNGYQRNLFPPPMPRIWGVLMTYLLIICSFSIRGL